jgi:hypothetical protein
MKNLILLSLFCVLLALSCEKENKKPKDNPPPCVGPEENFDTLTGFTIFEKGKQEFGYAKGIKINLPFELSVFIDDDWVEDSVFTFFMAGYWPEFKGHSALGEKIGFNRIPINNGSSCFHLTNNRNSVDSIYCSYNIVNDDVGILRYEIDINSDNKLEIISFDKTTKKLKARLKASFIGEKEYLPDLPKHVRFIDTYIEHGY